MSIDAARVLSLVGSAGRLVGLKEILRAGELNPGVQNDLKRILRELVRSGQLEQDGKRFGLPGKKYTQKSGPAWKGVPPASAPSPVETKKGTAPRGRFVRQWGEGFVSDAKEAVPAATTKVAASAKRNRAAVVVASSAKKHPRQESHPRQGKQARQESQPRQGKQAHQESQPRQGKQARQESQPRQGKQAHQESQPRQGKQPRQESQPRQQAQHERPQQAQRHGKQRTEHKPAATASGPARNLVTGVINHHRDGFAFVKPLGAKTGEDIFIPPDQARQALDHDQVVIEVIRERDGRSSGRLVEVKARTRQLVIGTYVERDDGCFVTPREAELGTIRVPKTQLARDGDVVKVRLGVGEKLLGAQQLTGEVAGSMGAAADHSIEVLSVAFSKGFQDEFPPEVMDEADTYPLEVSEAEATGEHRRDLRQMQLVTIDGEDARDFDDAIYVEADGSGWRLVVAIADVSHYVKEGTALDTEALRRATSVYLPGRVLPMLPERLSNGLCSLKPDVDRLCMVADMRIDRSGTTTTTQIYPAVMRSVARCTYTEVHQVLAGENVPHRNAFKHLFERANGLATTLTAMRRKRGSIEFDLPETRVELDDAGLPKGMVRRERWESHKLVEECMLAANESVARFFREQDLPTVNRFHDEPDEDKLATFISLLGAYGVAVKGEGLSSQALNSVLKQLEGHPEQRALNQLALRSMMQAIYSSKSSGHFGLGAEDYLHFTSPIRRYPDLLVHRLLKELWSKKKKTSMRSEAQIEKLEAMAQQSSERERAAMQVEREVNQLYSCLLMQGHVGEEFSATVAGLSDNGFYVELDELFVDGFVKGETIYPDFEFDQGTYRLTFGNGRVVKVGQKCHVQLTSVNIKRKQMDYEVISFEGEQPMQRRAPNVPGQGRGGREPQKRFQQSGGGGSRKPMTHRRERERERQPPPSNVPGGRAMPPVPPVQAGAAAPSSEVPGAPGFDPRAVLDRLWRERGGKPRVEESAPRRFESKDKGGSGGKDSNSRSGRYRR